MARTNLVLRQCVGRAPGQSRGATPVGRRMPDRRLWEWTVAGIGLPVGGRAWRALNCPTHQPRSVARCRPVFAVESSLPAFPFSPLALASVPLGRRNPRRAAAHRARAPLPPSAPEPGWQRRNESRHRGRPRRRERGGPSSRRVWARRRMAGPQSHTTVVRWRVVQNQRGRISLVATSPTICRLLAEILSIVSCIVW